jgi:cell fate (sporulation/competence/biofilm development) regulator YlbF (YheA/YmcA/DUF963 family)
MVSNPKATTSTENKALEAAKALSDTIQSTPEWSELVDVRHAIDRDREFGKMITRHDELERAQQTARDRGEGFAGKELVELIALRSRIQTHDLTVRQQEASRAVAQLLKQVNRTMSEGLGFDFASNVTPRRDRCCG